MPSPSDRTRWWLAVRLVVTLAILMWALPVVLRSVLTQSASTGWPSATATVTRSDVRESARLWREGYLTLEYRYEVAGQEFIGHGYSLMGITAEWFESPLRISGELPVGAQVEVHYSQTDPSVSTIRTGLAAYDIGLVALLILLLMGSFAWTVHLLRPRLKRDPVSTGNA